MNAVMRILVWLLALTLVMLPVVAVVNGWMGSKQWPLTKLRVQGEMKHVDAARLREVVLPYARSGFFAVRLQDAQDAVKKLPWVESAEVRKRWPNVLEVQIVEHKPFARWGENRLLSEHGNLFALPKGMAVQHMPLLGGSDTQIEAVVALYNQAREMFQPLGLKVVRLQMDQRGSWSLSLDNDLQVVIGRAEARLRLSRFVRMLPQLLANRSSNLERADLRYTNGFALSWGARMTAEHWQKQIAPGEIKGNDAPSIQAPTQPIPLQEQHTSLPVGELNLKRMTTQLRSATFFSSSPSFCYTNRRIHESQR